MAAKAWGEQQKSVEEMFFRNDAVSVCMMINRRAKTMRVIDFRAGPSDAKRLFVLSVAQREGIEKLYTLVERDEVSTWVRLGFAREGNIPGFYKRSDAFLLGCNVRTAQENHKRIEEARTSEMRIAIRSGAITNEAYSLQANDDERDDVDLEETAPVDAHAQALSERTIAQAKKRAKDAKESPAKAIQAVKVTITELREADIKKPLAAAVKAGTALTAFEPFGRDAIRQYFSVTGKLKSAAYDLVVSTESQSCFGNAYVEMLTAPKTDADKVVVISAVRALCDKLLAAEVVGCFALAPSDDVALATAFVMNGFRRTGLLLNHISVGGARKDAILWSRKLMNPADA
ncbi:hypothetical protein BH09MYX1_BH09MYX1_24830 [soil metagenome]